MNEKDSIIDEGSIILSYTFKYEENIIQDIKNKEGKNKVFSKMPKIGNLLSYADRILDESIEYNYPQLENKEIVLRIDNDFFPLHISYAKIAFFQNNMAILYFKIDLKKLTLLTLYKINRALTQFYMKEKNEDVSLYFGSKKIQGIKIQLSDFQQDLEKNCQKLKEYETIKNSIDIEVERFTTVYKNNYFKINKYMDSINNRPMIRIDIIKNNAFTKQLLTKYYPIYSPYQEDSKKAYPLSDIKIDGFSGRVGIIEGEKQLLEEVQQCQNKEKRHYCYFENQLRLVEKKANEENKIEFIHYDTFITSLILKFVAVNDRVKLYDNFNPTATSNLHSYITLVSNDINLKKVYEENFVNFEPLLNMKKHHGQTIIKPDFFKIYQSQADILTIGNAHSIVHILDKESKHIKNNKETIHYYIYIYTVLQRNFMLNIINSSIVNINKIGESNASIFDIKHNYKHLSDTIDKYNTFLTNYNFEVLSNSPSVNGSYEFFRKCNEVSKLASQWSTISYKLGNWKNILSIILQKHPGYFLFILGLAGIGIKIFNRILDIVLDIVFNFFTI